MSNSFPVEIRVHAEDKGLASDQIRALVKRFTKNLKLPKDRFETKSIRDNSVPKNYRIVFIINS